MTVLKKFGLGILWALLSPIILVAVALIGVFGAVDFVIEFGIMIVNFFRGKKLFPLYPEDEKALRAIFGDDCVFNFSGINKWTTDYHNYYEVSHYRPHVASEIMDSIYSGKR